MVKQTQPAHINLKNWENEVYPPIKGESPASLFKV